MSDYESWQALLSSGGNAAAVIMEMKRLLSVRTDSELAERLGKTQSAVAHWRRKNAVPEAVLLSMEDIVDPLKRLRDFDRDNDLRALMIRAITFHVQRQSDNAGVWRACNIAGVAIDCLYALVADTVDELERVTGKKHTELLGRLFDDEHYLEKVSDWLDAADLSEAIFAGEVVKPATAILPDLVY